MDLGILWFIALRFWRLSADLPYSVSLTISKVMGPNGKMQHAGNLQSDARTINRLVRISIGEFLVDSFRRMGPVKPSKRGGFPL